MTSPTLEVVIDLMRRERAAAGIRDDRYDLDAHRRSLSGTTMALPEGVSELAVPHLGIKCTWILARKANPRRRILYLHGGGYTAGSLSSHRSIVSWLSELTGWAVLFVEYSLAPEHRFPAAIEDASTALDWLQHQGPDGPVSDGELVLAGDSAGAGLAMALMLRDRDRGAKRISAAALICGMFDMDARSSKFIQSSQRIREMVRLYANDEADLLDPLASPVRALLHDLPPIFLQAGGADLCLQDSVALASGIQAADGQASLTIWPNMFHVWHRFAPILPEASAALREIGAFLNSTVANPQGA